MPVLGMVLVLDDSKPATRQAVTRALADAPDLMLGEPAEHRLPAVLESPDARRADARIDSLRAIPGIAGVDVVYADLEDLLEPSPSADALEES